MEEPLKTQTVHHGSSLKNKTTHGTPNKSVNFKISPVCEKEREKFLTAKYGAHQMSLIRKRLKVHLVLVSKYVLFLIQVEMWMYDHLQKLFSTEVVTKKYRKKYFFFKLISQYKEESKSNYVELDLDEVLDIEDEIQRRKFILVMLAPSVLNLHCNYFQNILIRSSAAREVKNVSQSHYYCITR